MECFKIENLSFTYPGRTGKALDNIRLTINQGEFITLCGKSGCGKTTLLKLLKPSLSPSGDLEGNIYFFENPLSDYNLKEQTESIGFVMQSAENQIVTDKVWHELAFGLESLGLPNAEIRSKVAEMASFFSIESWFHQKTSYLSGGQKQLLNLASVMVMQPKVLILDEPTSQLDPIAAQEFLKTLEKINKELGTTIILSEHRLEDAIPISDRVVVLENGKIIADSSPENVCEILKSQNHHMFEALPAPMRIFSAVENSSSCPLTVRDGRQWLEDFAKNHTLNPDLILKSEPSTNSCDTLVEIEDVWFRYEKNSPDIIKGVNIKIKKGELFAFMGGNGAGKTTLLSLIAGLIHPYRGKIKIQGKNISEIHNLYSEVLSMLPQNPQSVFVKKTVYLDLLEILSKSGLTEEEKETEIKNISCVCHIENLLDNHPYDLSGGEQQRAALAKVLLKNPKILLLDEPTKGMDAHFKEDFAEILKSLKSTGVTVIMVSHDIEFCAKYMDRCSLVFDGGLTSTGVPREFFSGKHFYTTSANRMARNILNNAILAEDVILASGGSLPEKEKISPPPIIKEHKKPEAQKQKKKLSPARLIIGVIFAMLFALTCISYMTESSILNLTNIPWLDTNKLQLITILEVAIAIFCLFPQKSVGEKKSSPTLSFGKNAFWGTLFLLIAIPLTIYIGIYYFQDRKYYFISLLIIFETMLPFFMSFEKRKPKARELVLISVLCAIAVAGRWAFMMLPQFKPVLALVIITGVCFGGETGFLVGVIIGFVSNFFFGQGPWTPWQMIAIGSVGFIAGMLFKTGLVKRTKITLCLYGFIATVLIHGVILNTSFIFQSQTGLNLSMLRSACIAGLPFDLIHAVSTVFFLWFLSEPMIDKLERIKSKYDI